MPIDSIYVPRNLGKGEWSARGSVETVRKKDKSLSKSPIFLCFCHGRARHRVSFVMGQSEWEDSTRRMVEEDLARAAKARTKRKKILERNSACQT